MIINICTVHCHCRLYPGYEIQPPLQHPFAACRLVGLHLGSPVGSVLICHSLTQEDTNAKLGVQDAIFRTLASPHESRHHGR